jgi:hypothetical protein
MAHVKSMIDPDEHPNLGSKGRFGSTPACHDSRSAIVNQWMTT